MSGPTAPNWYVEQWQDTATDVYQASGFSMRGTTTDPVKIQGKSMHFPIAGIVGAEEDVQTGDTAAAQNAVDSEIIITTKKSRVYTEVYEDDLDQMTVEQNQVEGRRSAKALGRVHDRTIVKELNTGTLFVGAYATAFSLPLALQAAQKLQAGDIPWMDDEIFCALDSVSWNIAIGTKQFSSSDWNGPDLPFAKKSLAKTWNGIHFFQLPDSILRAFETVGTQATSLMWARSAMGFGFVRQLTGSVVWDNKKDCWGHNMRMRIGAKKIFDAGIVKIRSLYDPTTIVLT